MRHVTRPIPQLTPIQHFQPPARGRSTNPLTNGEISGRSHEQRPTRSSRRRASKPCRVVLRRVTQWTGVLLMTAALVVIGFSLLAPQQTEHIYGQLKTQALHARDTATKAVAPAIDTTPSVKLGVTGGHAELDLCDGTFTHMESYGTTIPPVWAAHNNCGGDVILGWEIGQQVKVSDSSGQEKRYRVADIKYAAKTWSTVEDLAGLTGDFALQSCFYGEDRMKFVGLVPVS